MSARTSLYPSLGGLLSYLDPPSPSQKIYVLLIFSHEILDCRFFKFSFSLKIFFYMYLLRSGTNGGQRSTARMSAGDGTQALRLVPRGLQS